eukprot:NODE_62_length_2783_cov_96.622165_g58_i0.p1 GENE.NODE_62_length_2783_cov_96.622165_g58_i0~~NODE_62_length_2783_cov_96.622165_g58_i0.p1  ORF type:complete len:324 (-),score=61.01 NODE_62_length_2783_cov_96.622165_g58_i0:1046-2017(-)
MALPTAPPSPRTACVEGSISVMRSWGCQNGRLVSHGCSQLNAGNTSRKCIEILCSFEQWGNPWLQDLIRNLNLDTAIAYLGTNLTKEVRRRFANREPVVFYWWQPDPFLAKHPSTMLNFPPHSTECANRPGGSNCSREPLRLYKGLNPKVPVNSDLHRFWDAYGFSQGAYMDMLRYHKEGGGKYDAYNAACQWIKDHQNVWRLWINNNYIQPPKISASSDSGGMSTGVLVGIIVAAVVVLVGLLVLLWRKTKTARRVRSLMRSVELAEATAEAIATFDFEGETVATLQRLSNPSRLQKAFLVIIKLLIEYRAYHGMGGAFRRA